MKKLLFLLIIPLFFACGSDDDNKDGDGLEIQDYTSFVIENKYIENETFFFLKAAYKNDKGAWVKLADLGNLSRDKQTQEVKLTKYYSEIRLFCKFYADTDIIHWYSFEIKENRKNTLKLEESTQWQVVKDITDPKQYPQE